MRWRHRWQCIDQTNANLDRSAEEEEERRKQQQQKNESAPKNKQKKLLIVDALYLGLEKGRGKKLRRLVGLVKLV